MTGTVSELGSQLKAHLSSHPELQDNPRISGLFLSRRHQVDVDTAVIVDGSTQV
jgi:hypothetical protein